MKFLLKDELIAKLRKVPTVLWVFLLAASFFFARAYGFISDAKTVADTLATQWADTVAAAGVDFDVDTFMVIVLVFSAIATAFIYAGIFELFMRIAHTVALRRYGAACHVSEFTFRLRLVMIVANVILGLVGIFDFFFPVAVNMLDAVFRYAVPTVFFALFYDDFRRKFVPKKNVASLFVFVARIYIIIYFAIALFTSVYELVLYRSELSVLDIVALATYPTIIALSAVAAYIYAAHLKKVALEQEDNELFIIKEETPDKEDDNVFKDLGF